MWRITGDVIQSLGLPVENRPLWPHVSLVRFRRRLSLPETFPAFPPLSLEISALTLYESVSTPEGSRYEVLREFPLADP